MKPRRLLIPGILIALARGLLAAPAPEVPPPQAPWVAPVPERGQWRIVASDPAAKVRTPDAPAAPRPQGIHRQPIEIESLTWDAVKRDIVRYSDNSTETLIYYAGFVLVEGQSSRGNPAPVLVQQFPGTDLTTWRSSGWLGMDWIHGSFYAGPREYQKQAAGEASKPELCYYFHRPENKSDDGLPELHAWVRVADQQPVAFRVGRKTFEFNRLDPPAAAPGMTREQAAKLLELKDQNERMQRLRERNKRLRGE